jgi:hypothetical protein
MNLKWRERGTCILQNCRNSDENVSLRIRCINVGRQNMESKMKDGKGGGEREREREREMVAVTD